MASSPRQRLTALRRIERGLWALAHPDAGVPCADHELDDAAHLVMRVRLSVERPGYLAFPPREAQP